MLSRREALAGLSSSAGLSLAGCTWLTGTTTDLAGVQVTNPVGGTEDVDVRVEQDGDIVVEESLSVDQEEGAETVPCDWERNGENPIIEARLADVDSEWRRLDLADRDEEVAQVTISIYPGRGITAMTVLGPDDGALFTDLCAEE